MMNRFQALLSISTGAATSSVTDNGAHVACPTYSTLIETFEDTVVAVALGRAVQVDSIKPHVHSA